jgi:ubiquinone/menaquinone biosynthesis C-methylase UbiE
MSDMQHEHYEQVAYTGNKLKYGNDEWQRVMGIKSVIPQGVKRILDCGCGDGRLGNLLKDEYTVEGCDISSESLKHCKFPTIRCSVTKLPFQDRYFDLVISSEVLEHILPGDYEQACREIERVTRKWVIVTVPNREDLDGIKQQCPHCGTIFHDAWHVRSFDKKILANSFSNFSVKHWFYVGHKQRLDLMLRRRLRNWVLGYPKLWPNRQCPLCHCFGTASGEQDVHAPSESAQNLADRRPEWYKKLRHFALKVVPGRSRWLGVLLVRQNLPTTHKQRPVLEH